ncbi:MAG: hypothetical protein IT338_03865 [Thermomicrobiales bacterium]|nr:hypothetical protein [Thermomicrobiales bacterium]
MDLERFDHLAHGLAAGITRRRLAGHLTGAAIGAILMGTGASEADARKKRSHHKHKRPRNRCITCSATCPGAAESSPIKTLSFTPTSDPNYCAVIVNLTRFAGCTAYTADYWVKAMGDLGTVTLGPTDLNGSSQTNLGSFAQGGELDIRINGVATGWTAVSC